MHTIVKILDFETGIPDSKPKWHLSYDYDDADRAFCNGQVYGYGESEVRFETKKVEKGGITCSHCLKMIKEIKSIKS